MVDNARAWLGMIGALTAGVAGIIFLTSPNTSPKAMADPVAPSVPAPVTVTQTVTLAPARGAPVAAPQAATAQPATAQAATAPAATAPVATAPAVPQSGLANVAPSVAAPTTPTLVPATSGTMIDYFKTRNVRLEPQRAPGFQAFNITLPMPQGWSQVPDPNVPDAFAVIANRTSPDLYTPNAQVIVYRLVGDFDPKEAITHGFIDSQSLLAWQTTDASLADFYGSPSSIIEGTYRQNDMTLNTSRRHVIVTSGADRYLVSLSVTSMASRQGAPAAADATDAIVNGFRVGAAAPVAPPPAAPLTG
jgi:hypothetical protein